MKHTILFDSHTHTHTPFIFKEKSFLCTLVTVVRFQQCWNFVVIAYLNRYRLRFLCNTLKLTVSALLHIFIEFFLWFFDPKKFFFFCSISFNFSYELLIFYMWNDTWYQAKIQLKRKTIWFSISFHRINCYKLNLLYYFVYFKIFDAIYQSTNSYCALTKDIPTIFSQ